MKVDVTIHATIIVQDAQSEKVLRRLDEVVTLLNEHKTTQADIDKLTAQFGTNQAILRDGVEDVNQQQEKTDAKT